jgi:hypothetical protein
MTITRDQQRRVDYALDRIRRPRTVKCKWCGRTTNVPTKGRLPNYCSASHRQLAYQQRKWQKQPGLLALQQDLGEVERRTLVRQELRATIEALLRKSGFEEEADIVASVEPRGPELRVIPGGKSADPESE